MTKPVEAILDVSTHQKPLTTIEVIDANPSTELITDIVALQTKTQMTESKAFQQTLAMIPTHVARANKLLADYRKDASSFVETVNEEDVDLDLKEMAEIVKFSSTIDKNRKEIKRYYEAVRDGALAQLDGRLQDAQFDSLKTAHSDVKQLKKDIQNQRAVNRWKELAPVFAGTIQHYPLIEELASELLDFNRFRLIHVKLVSGAKTKPITEVTRREVTQIIGEWNTALELIKANQWGLNATKQFDLLKSFKSNPSVGLVNEQGPAYKTQQDAQEERVRQEAINRKNQEDATIKANAERTKREEELRKQQDLLKKAQTERERTVAEERTKQLQAEAKLAEDAEKRRKDELDQLVTQNVSPHARQSYPNVVEFIFSNTQYKELHTNARAKAAAIFDLSTQLSKPNSPIMKDSNGDPNIYLEIIRFVLDA